MVIELLYRYMIILYIGYYMFSSGCDYFGFTQGTLQRMMATRLPGALP